MKNCLNCDKELNPNLYRVRIGRARFCCPKCRGMALRKEKNNKWRGGIHLNYKEIVMVNSYVQFLLEEIRKKRTRIERMR